MSKFYLVRHGHHAYLGNTIVGWREGVGLSEEGRSQADRLAHQLAGSGISAIYSSPLERALATAEPLARRIGLSVQPRDAFGEIRFGEWTGRTLKELSAEPLWNLFNTYRSSTRPPDGEMMIEVQTRVVSELEQLRSTHPGQSVAIFSHGDVIKAALIHYAGIPIDLCHRIEISPASITTIALHDYGPQILAVNAFC